MKRALVLGASGFIGRHLASDLQRRDMWVRGVDLKSVESSVNEFVIADLRDSKAMMEVFDIEFDEVYQLAANMGGAGFIFTGKHDAQILQHNARINLNCAESFRQSKSRKLFFASSACIYPKHNQASEFTLDCREETAYPADPDSAYGWEKLFAENLYLAHRRNFDLDIKIGRFHNVYGENCAFEGGREKVPAALCRKVAQAPDGGTIEVWGDGLQTRSFLYIEDCLKAMRLLMNSEHSGPYNIGSEEMVSIGQLAQLIIEISGKRLNIKFCPGPLGVRSRNSNNRKIERDLNWKPCVPLRIGMEKLYHWVNSRIALCDLENLNSPIRNPSPQIQK